MASPYPQVRRRPTKQKLLDTQRDSNFVRASVLETALELGLTQNSTVANWIFNNPLAEEPEDIQLDTDKSDQLHPKSELTPEVAEAITPTLTSGSNTTSDESFSISPPHNNVARAAVATFKIHTHKPSVTEPPRVSFGDFPSDQLQLFSPFSLSPPEPYRGETDGNSLPDPHKDTERSRSQDDSLRRNPSHEAPSLGPADAGYTSEGQYLSKGKAGKGKGKEKSKLKKAQKPQTLELNKGGGGDTDYASDGGYLSASSNKSQGKSPGKVKARAMAFFRKRQKKPAHGSDDEDEDEIPPVPAIPTLPKPSNPKPLERRAPSSPIRSGFHPLTLQLTSPPESPAPRRRVSKSPPPRGATPHRLGQSSASQPPSVLTPAATAATFPLPPSAPGTPLTSSPAPAILSTPIAAPTPTKGSPSQPPRPHLGIPPPAPPPSQPLPQPPPSPSASPLAMPSTLPLRPGTPSKKGVPSRPVPVAPAPSGYPGLQSPQPLSMRRPSSPFRPMLSPKIPPATSSEQKALHTPSVEVYGSVDCDQPNGTEVAGKQQSTASRSTPAFLQRRIQHPPPSPRHPPPDMPLPPAPSPTPSARARTPVGSPSKFHEHFASVSSVPASTTSPTQSTVTLSGSSSGPSVRSSHISSTSDRSEVPPVRDSLATSDYSRPSSTSETSYVRPRFNRVSSRLKSRFSDRSEVASSIYPPTTHRDSTTTYDDDGDIDDAASKSYVDDEDDASVYPSEEKTAGRRTMYLLEHGGLDENGDEIVIAGSHYWGKEVPPPLPTRPGFF